MINVTKTFLPPQDEYNRILQRAWGTGWMTNRGVLVKELEENLKRTLKVENLIATTNGTLPIQIAIKALQLEGEIITTPFSYVATTSSIVWEGCTPVFVDIDPEYLCIDSAKIEAAITNKTSAILATHVFGNPCDVETIHRIAKKHNLHVIYDAAHCFGVTYKGESLFNFGDVSTCSFHATKVFHTAEGGAIISNNNALNDTIFYHHNFGHDGPEAFQGIGINAKMSELQAAMGLAVLPYMQIIFENRKKVVDQYLNELKTAHLQFLKLREGTGWNYCYFPLIFDSQEELLIVQKALNNKDIFPRRYFYPSLNKVPYVDKVAMPVSESISEKILCLPLSHSLTSDMVMLICQTINDEL